MSSVLNLIKSKNFPCTVAKTLVAKDKLVIKNYSFDDFKLKDLQEDLISFRKNLNDKDKYFKSFIAEFNHPTDKKISFDQFESFFWNQLSSLRQTELGCKNYDESVSKNPEDSDFGFSIEGSAYFLILLHPDSPRMARRSANPAIVFNLHLQFEELRADGIFEKFVKIIRRRDLKLQGRENPMTKNFGHSPEWLQFSGREMPLNSKCPFS